MKITKVFSGLDLIVAGALSIFATPLAGAAWMAYKGASNMPKAIVDEQREAELEAWAKEANSTLPGSAERANAIWENRRFK